MKSSHYLALAIRVFAIVIFVYAIQQSSMLVQVILDGSINGMTVSLWLALCTAVTPFLVSIILLWFPFTVSNMILRPEFDQPIEPLHPTSILTVFILTIGLYTLYYAIVDTVYWATLWNMSANSEYSDTSLSLDADSKASMITTAVEFSVSIGFILKARTLAAKLFKVTE